MALEQRQLQLSPGWAQEVRCLLKAGLCERDLDVICHVWGATKVYTAWTDVPPFNAHAQFCL